MALPFWNGGASLSSIGGRCAIAQTVKGITVQIGGETKGLEKAIKSLNSDAKKLQSELKGVNTLLKLDPKNVTLLKQKQELLTKSVDQTREKLEKLQAAQDEADQAIASGIEVNEKEYRNLRREIASTEQKLKSLESQQREFASVSAVQLQAVGAEFRSMGQKVSQAGEALVPLTAAIAAVGAASVAASVQFESSFAGVRKTVDATEQEFEELAEATREAAMAKPVDVNDINYIMELGGQLGIATEYLSKFASVIGDLSVSTNLGVEDASMQLARFMNIMNTATTDIDRLGAALVGLGNNSATTEADIMEMAMRIAGAGGQIGLTEAQVLGLAASLSSVGIEAQMGGSAISRTMSEIDVAVATGSEALDAWADAAGMSAQEFAAAWEEDAATALTQLFAGMEQAVAEGENINLILQELGITELRQTDTLKRLTSAASLMSDTMGIANVSWEENVALTNEAEQRYATTESRLKMLKNEVVDIGISLGNGLKGALLAVMDALKPVLDGVQVAARAFENANPGIQMLITGSVGLTAALGPMLIITGKITEGMGTLMASLGKSAAALTAKTVATSGNTAALISNETAVKKSTLAVNAQILKDAIKEATDTRLAAKTVAKTAATAADTVATGANTTATSANGAAALAASIRTTALTVATKAKTAAATAATVAQLAWNAALSANPIGAVVLAVSALVGTVGALAVAVSSAADKQQSLTKVSQDQRNKIEELQAAYDKAVAAQGEHSDAAVRAKYALDQETAAFEDSKETIGDFVERCEQTVQAQQELRQSTQETAQDADSQAGMILHLTEQIAQLAEVENRSAQEKAELSALTAALAGSCEGLALSYDQQNDALSMNVETLQAAAKAEADRLRSAAAMENYQELISSEVEIMAALEQAQAELQMETQRNAETWGMLGSVQVYTSQAQIDLEATVQSLNGALEDNRAAQNQAMEISARYATRQSVLEKAIAEVEAGTLSAEEAAAKYSYTVEGGLQAQEIQAQIAAKNAEKLQALAKAVSATEGEIKNYSLSSETFSKAMEDASMTASSLAASLQAQGAEFQDAKDAMLEYSAQSADAFTKIADSSENTLVALRETLAYNLEATQNWNANLEAVFSRTGVSFSDEFLAAVLEGGVAEYGTVLAQMAALSDVELQKISDSFARNGQEGTESYLLEQRLLVDKQKESYIAMEVAAAEAGTGIGAAYGENATIAMGERCEVLSESARIWGEDAGSQFASGLGSTVSAVAAAATSVANAARSILHFSVPDEGPLADADEYGPDFGQLIADGLLSKVDAVRNAAAVVAQAARGEFDGSFSKAVGFSLNPSQPSVSAIASGPLASGATSSSQQTMVTNNFYGSITLSANDVKDIQTFDDFASRLQKEMRAL